MLNDFIPRAVLAFPSVIPHLKSGYYKTYEYFDATLRRMVTAVYNGNMGGDFVDTLAALLRGQITQAFRQAYEDEGFTDMFPPAYLQTALDNQITAQVQFDWIYQYYKDIVDARVDSKPLDPLLARVSLWANRYTESYNLAVMEIQKAMGGKLMWKLGATEQHCDTCSALDGIVAFAAEWDLAGCKPQSAPNSALTCGGWQCDCSLVSTDKRRSPNAFDRIMAARK